MIIKRWMHMLVAMVYSVQCKYTGIRNTSLHGHGAYLRMLAILYTFSRSNTVSGRSIIQRGGLLVTNTAQAVQYVALVAGGFETTKQAVCGSCGETCVTAGEKSICVKCGRRKELRKKCDEETKKYEETWKRGYAKIISKEESLEKEFENLKKKRDNLEGPKTEWESKLREKHESLEEKHESLKKKCEILKKKHENSNSEKETSQDVSDEEYKKKLKKQWEDKLKEDSRSNVKEQTCKAKKSYYDYCKYSRDKYSSMVRDVNEKWNYMEKLVKERCYRKHVEEHKKMLNDMLSEYANGAAQRESIYNIAFILWYESILSVMCEELDEDSLWVMRRCAAEMEEIGNNEVMEKAWNKKVKKNKVNLTIMFKELYKMQSALKEKYNKLKNECHGLKEKQIAELEKKCEETKRKYEEDVKVIRDVKGRDGGELTKKCDELKMECESETRKYEKEMKECEKDLKRKLEVFERKEKEEDAKLKEEIVRNFLGKIKRTRDELKREYEEEVRKCEEGMEKCKREMEEMIIKRKKELEEGIEECKKGMKKCEIEKQRMLEDLKNEKEKIQRKYERDGEKREGPSFFQALRDTFLN